MCLTCGCMDAHKEMGENNITFEDLERAAMENGKSVQATLETFNATIEQDRSDHAGEYAAEGATA